MYLERLNLGLYSESSNEECVLDGERVVENTTNSTLLQSVGELGRPSRLWTPKLSEVKSSP